MELYAIRHLATPYNMNGWLQGSKDVSIYLPLSDSILTDIQSNVELLRSLTFDAVLCSELKRTHETAKEYGYNDCAIEPLINELNFGEWEGRPKVEMLEDIGEVWSRNPLQLVLGEPLVAFQDRLKAFLSKYKSYDRVLCFAHGAVLRALKSISLEGNIENMNNIEIPNNTLIKIDA